MLIILSFLELNAKDKYLIITCDKYYHSEKLKIFIDYRSNDFDVEIILNSEIGTQAEQFIDFINQQNPKYILLVGNYTDFPSKTIPYSKPVESYNYWVAKQVDSLYQIKIPLGLFLVDNETELENIIKKTITFEQNLDEIPNKLYTHSGSIEALPPWPIEFNDEILNEMHDSFFKNNGYLHRHETSLDDTPNDAIGDIQAINNGVKYIIYHGHGLIHKWSFGMGVQGIDYLENDEFFPIIFSASCLTGTFTGNIDTMEGSCFATKMLSSEKGAVAFIGAYNISSKGQNPMLYGFSKYVNEKEYERLGDALVAAYNNIEMPETVKKYYPHITAYEYNRARFQFHLFGDPALLINKSATNVNENSNQNQVTISPNPASDYIEINIGRCPTLQECLTSEIRIYNVMGELMMTGLTPTLSKGKGVRINISHLPAGVYFIKFGNYSHYFIMIR